MKIAYIVPSLINSGPIKVVHQLVGQLSAEHSIDIYYFKTVTTRENLTFEVPTQQIGFTEKIDFDRYDIIHSHTILPDAYIWYHHSHIGRARTVSTLHSYAREELVFTYGRTKGYLLTHLWNLATSRHDVLAVLSQNALAYYRRFWRNQSLTCVYNGIDASPYRDRPHRQSKHGRIKIGNIASAGGINRRKGIDQIIRALPRLPQYELYIAGKESEESKKLDALTKQLGVGERVHFLGYVTDIEIFIAEMDLFVVSARSEGFPLSLQEIVSHKKAVVCSDIPLFREIFTEDEIVFFGLDEIDALISAIERLAENRDFFVENAYRRFVREYTSQKMAENYLGVYGRLLQRDRNDKQ